MALPIIIVTGAPLGAAINLCAWGVSEAESDEKRRVAKGRGVMMVFLVIALSLWGLSASALTVDVDLYEGDSNVRRVGYSFVPVDGIDTHEAKYECPAVGPSWKRLDQDRVMRERKCEDPFRLARGTEFYPEPLGLAPSPVIYSTPGRYAGTGWFGQGVGGCGCSGGGHTPPHETPLTPTVPIPAPAAFGLLLAALGGIVILTAPRGREETR